MLTKAPLRSSRALRAGFTVLVLTSTIAMLTPASHALAAPQQADLTVSVVANKASISTKGGDRISISISVRNVGAAAADDVTLAITIPPSAGRPFDSLFRPEWGACEVETTPWTCVHGPLAAGATAAPMT